MLRASTFSPVSLSKAFQNSVASSAMISLLRGRVYLKSEGPHSVRSKEKPIGCFAEGNATIRDVAAASGLSTATVSRVLSGADSVSPETARRVLAQVDALGYTVNRVARSLKTRSTRTVGVIAPELASDFFMLLAESMESALSAHGYSLIVCSSRESEEAEGERLRLLGERLVDGVVVIPSTGSGTELARARSTAPLVLVDRFVEGLGADSVLVDNEGGAYDATMALVAEGHRRIGFVGGGLSVSIARERYQGWRRAMRESGLAEEGRFVSFAGLHVDSGYEAMRAMRSYADAPDAYFIVNAYTHLGATNYLVSEEPPARSAAVAFAALRRDALRPAPALLPLLGVPAGRGDRRQGGLDTAQADGGRPSARGLSMRGSKLHCIVTIRISRKHREVIMAQVSDMKVQAPTLRLKGALPKIGIRPAIDGRRLGVRESLEEPTMGMAKAAAKLISTKLRHPSGHEVECVIADSCIGGVAEAAACAEKFAREGVAITLTVTPCWCYGSETMDMDPMTVKAVWGFNGTDRPGAVYLAAVLAAHSQKGLPAFGIYGRDVMDLKDTGNIPPDVAEKILRFARAGLAAAWMRGKSYLSIGSVAMGIAGSTVNPDFFQDYLGMRNESVDMSELIRRFDEKIYSEAEFKRALEWVKANCKEGPDNNPPEAQHSRERKDKTWATSVKMAMIVRDLMVGSPDLKRKGLVEESLGHKRHPRGLPGTEAVDRPLPQRRLYGGLSSTRASTGTASARATSSPPRTTP